MWAAQAQAPTIEKIPDLMIVRGNSVIAFNNPTLPLKLGVLGDLVSKNVEYTVSEIKAFIEENYPDKKDLLIFMVDDESRYCQALKGDNGLAYGCFQIHLDKHPSINYECAMDFKCSLAWTVNKINKGEGKLWTSYRKFYEIPY